ncbi:MAG: hypothetical protein ACLFRY_15605 [Spirochaetia bacterium]
MPGKKSIILTIFLACLASHGWALDTAPSDLTGEYRTILDPLFTRSLDLTTTPEELQEVKDRAVEELLEEVRYLVSGQIYGFTFAYTPLDRARTVEEEFILEPIARIIRGDRNLRVREADIRNDILTVLVRYHLEEFQRSRIERWMTNTLPSSTGAGSADYFLEGSPGRLTAVGEAVKEAVRNYLRKREFNKPKRIEGRVLLLEAPRIFLDEGRYVARVRVKLDVEKILHYETF